MTLKILKFFGADPGSGMEKSRIWDKHPGSATLDKNVGSGQLSLCDVFFGEPGTVT
jgi:hypothetical protein